MSTQSQTGQAWETPGNSWPAAGRNTQRVKSCIYYSVQKSLCINMWQVSFLTQHLFFFCHSRRITIQLPQFPLPNLGTCKFSVRAVVNVKAIKTAAVGSKSLQWKRLLPFVSLISHIIIISFPRVHSQWNALQLQNKCFAGQTKYPLQARCVRLV